MPAGQVVRLVNEGDTPFRDGYNNQQFTIPPNGELFIDWDAMCLWLGHPEANDLDPRNRVRVAEYQRLRSRYGVDAVTLEHNLAKIPVDADEMFQQMRPKLTAYDMSGERIITVADDPSGDSLTPTLISSDDSQSLILARMQQMEQEMANMRAQLASKQRQDQALNDAQPIPTDLPPTPDHIDVSQPVRVGATGIPGTIPTSEPPADATTSPRPAPRTTPGEDTPTRVRVSQG